MRTRRSIRRPRARRPVGRPEKAYMFVSRTPGGRLRTERFETSAEYRLRLVAVRSSERPVSLDELIDLLEV